MKEEVCVAVFTAQDRHFDEFDRSYLPLFHSIYGVYEDMNDALNDVYTFLYSVDILPSLKERDSGVIGSSLRCRSYATSPQSRCPDS